jgi:hypothetical protein
MNEVRHAAHLRAELVAPGRVVEVVVRRKLGPDTVDQPQRPVGMRRVPCPERTVEGRGKDRVEPDGIGVHGRQRVQPARIERGIGGKLGGKPPGERYAQVHALDPDGPPAGGRPDLEALTRHPRRQLHLRGPLRRRGSCRRGAGEDEERDTAGAAAMV